MQTGIQAQAYHRLMWHVRTGLAYDGEGDYALSLDERRFYLLAAKAIRTGYASLPNIKALDDLASLLRCDRVKTWLLKDFTEQGRTLITSPGVRVWAHKAL